MSKVFRFILIFSLSIILFECSFDNKTGIWSDKQKRKNANTELIKLSNVENKFQKELNPELKINFNSKQGIQINFKKENLKPEEYMIDILQDQILIIAFDYGGRLYALISLIHLIFFYHVRNCLNQYKYSSLFL